MKIKGILLVIALFIITGCASQHIKYEPQPFTPPAKIEMYKLPVDPFVGDTAPIAILLKKATNGSLIPATKEDAEYIAFTSKDLQRITLRLQYYKDERVMLENQINMHIQRENMIIDLSIDQNVLKELLREMIVDMKNKMNSDKNWAGLEKGGYMAVILGLLLEMAIMAAH